MSALLHAFSTPVVPRLPQNNPPIFVSNLVGALAASYAKPGDVLFYQEEVASDLYFLVTGKVNLFATFSVSQAYVAEKCWRSPAYRKCIRRTSTQSMPYWFCVSPSVCVRTDSHKNVYVVALFLHASRFVRRRTPKHRGN